MSKKRAAVYIIAALLVGIMLGGISRFTNVDFGIAPAAIAIIVICAIAGTDHVISSKKK